MTNTYHRSNLRPGGYIELFDVAMGHSTCDDDSLPETGSYLAKWDRLVLDCSYKWGSPVDSVLKYKEYLAEVGFTNIVEHEYIWPSNSWPKDHHHKVLGKPKLVNTIQSLCPIHG